MSDVVVVKRSTDIESVSAVVTAANTRAMYKVSQAIEANTSIVAENTEKTARNTARMVFEQFRTNDLLRESIEYQSLQVQLALKSNEELRSIDAAIQVLGADLKQAGRETNALLHQTNEVLAQSLNVQTELLTAIQREHARVEADRAAKRLIYHLERVVSAVEAEHPNLVRAYAATVVLEETGANGFSVDQVFEIADKRTLDSIRDRFKGMTQVTEEEKAELERFRQLNCQYYSLKDTDPTKMVPKARHCAPHLPEVSTDEIIGNIPSVGNRMLDPALAEKLRTVLLSLDAKVRPLKTFRIIVGAMAAFFTLISIIIMFAMPVIGLVLFILVFGATWMSFFNSSVVRMVSNVLDLDVDSSEEDAFLLHLRTTPEGATAALIKWAQYLAWIKRENQKLAREAAAVERRNEEIREKNAEILRYNKARTQMIEALKVEWFRHLQDIWRELESFLNKYPSLRKWYAMPEDLPHAVT